MNEHELLQHIYARAAKSPDNPAVELGPGDDCCVLRFGGERLLITTDQLVEGRHYELSATIDQIARKAVARSISDIAAMGGEPISTLAAACLPPDYLEADELFDKVHKWCEHFGAPLVGGDIVSSDGPNILTITTIGRTSTAGEPILRSGAKPGDALYVTGKLGGSFQSGRHLSFDPRCAESTQLVRTLASDLHAMIDLSDGLGRDGARIAEASAVRLVFEEPALPIHDDVAGWEQAVSDGEDYELLFAVADGAPVPPMCNQTGTLFTRIGRVEPGSGCAITLLDGSVINIAEMGWDHGRTG